MHIPSLHMLNWFHCFQALIGEAENIVQQIFIAALVFSQKFYAHYLDTPTSVSDPFINLLFVKNVFLNILALLFFPVWGSPGVGNFSLYISGGWDTYVVCPYATGMFHSLNVCFSCAVCFLWELWRFEMLMYFQNQKTISVTPLRLLVESTLITSVLLYAVVSGSMDRKDFLREAQIMKNLRHPKLIQLYAVCTLEDPIFIITELMRHGSLLEYLKSKQMTLNSF